MLVHQKQPVTGLLFLFRHTCNGRYQKQLKDLIEDRPVFIEAAKTMFFIRRFDPGYIIFLKFSGCVPPFFIFTAT